MSLPGLNFQLGEDIDAVRDVVQQFAAKEIAPRASEIDSSDEFPMDLWQKMGELGLHGITVPEEYGGSDMGYVAHMVAMEEISRASASVALSYGAHSNLCINQIKRNGSEEQKQKYLPKLISGEFIGALAMSEPDAGSDVVSMKLKAEEKGGHYVLNGGKMWITNGPDADVMVVYAKTNPELGAKGMTAFIVEKGMEGFSFGKKEHKLGIHTSLTTGLIFKDVKVPVENRLGEEGEGYKIAMKTLDGGRIGVAAQALGIAQAALDHAVKYSKERVQFGKPICKNQAISFKLADMATKIEAARMLVYKAAISKQEGEPYAKEAAMAKMFASDIAMEVATDAVQIFGGYGYSEEYPVARLFRNAKITQIFEGTNEVQRMVISSAILGQ